MLTRGTPSWHSIFVLRTWGEKHVVSDMPTYVHRAILFRTGSYCARTAQAMENLRPWPGAFCKLLLVHPRATLTMELWKLFALVFAFLAGRCALGADDDVDSDVARTRDFDLNMAWDAHRDPHHGMTSNAVPNHAHPPFMVADDISQGTNDIGNLGDEVAMSTAALGRGRVPASYAIGHQLSGIPNWAPANVVRCMPDFGRQDSVADSQHQPTTYNVGAGATISWTAAKDTPDTCIHCGNQLPRFSCTHCGKRLSSAFSLRRHLTTHYKQQQNTMSNVDAGASTSASVPDNTHVTGIHCRKKVSHQGKLQRHQAPSCTVTFSRWCTTVTCVDCGKQVLGRSLARHQKRSCPALLLRKSYCPHCRHQAEFSRPDTMGRS